ncbi:MAG TPA: exodeoxyribonuclease III [Cytophagaceae bacterium]
MLNIISWNVNGIRSIMKKDFVRDIKTMNPDILCLQETKAGVEDVKTLCAMLPEYKVYANDSKVRKGYSGTAILTRQAPLNVTCDMNMEEHDQEGRVITAEYEHFYLINVYVPNSGEGLKRLDYREKWDADFLNYIQKLNAQKPVIICGDLNVVHTEIDIARPKQNYNKSAGYTQREIDGFERLLNAGFVDTFRHFHPGEIKYTYWNNFFKSRERNVGWRIDYVMVSQSLIPQVKEASISNEYMGSDHCPIGLKIEI